MVRVTEAEVRAIFQTDLADLTPFIYAASAVVDSELGDAGLADSLLKEIERWLAAHFAAAADPTVSQQRVGDTAFTFEGVAGDDLKETRYGRRAIALDPTGRLATRGAARASLRVTHAPHLGG